MPAARTGSASSSPAEPPAAPPPPPVAATEKRRPAGRLPAARRRSGEPDGGRLLLTGPPGAGKTRRLAVRVRELLDSGVEPASVLVLALSGTAAASLSRAMRAALDGERRRDGKRASAAREHGCEPPQVLTPSELGLALLRASAVQRGDDPFPVVASKAERLAMLLGRPQPPGGQGRPAAAAARAMAAAVERIDRLKQALIDAERYAAWAGTRGGSDAAADRQAQRSTDGLAALYLEHERLLAACGALDAGDLLLRSCTLLDRDAGTARRLAARYSHLIVDGLEDPSPACARLIALLSRHVGEIAAAGAERDLAAALGEAVGAERPRLVRLPAGDRPPEILAAAAAALRGARRSAPPGLAEADRHDGPVSFWRCADERSQADCVAADIERLIGEGALSSPRAPGAPGGDGDGEPVPGRRPVAILVRSLAREGPAIVGALKERAIPYRVLGGCAFFECAEVRDLLCWLRLVSDPADTAAGLRLLTRPPVQLRPAELAHVSQLARRRRLDMAAAAAAAVDSNVLSPEARQRVTGLLELHQELASGLDELRPHELVHGLIERTGLRRGRLLPDGDGPPDGLLGLARLEELAAHFLLLHPDATAGELAAYLLGTAEAGLALEAGLGDEAAGAEERWWPLLAQAPAGGEAVVDLLALDAARGREFAHVYIVGLAGSVVPSEGPQPPAGISERAGAGGPEPAALPPPATEQAAATAPASGWPPDLRRRLHMAMGRAATRLVLCYAARDAEGAARPALEAAEDARRGCGQPWEDRLPAWPGASGALDSGLRMLRRRALADILQVGGALGDLRLDTDYDISQGVVRYLELLKLAALRERPPGQALEEALLDINARLLGACTPLEREIFESSTLDRELRAALVPPPGAAASPPLVLAGEDALLAPLLPRHGAGLVLSASDIATYRDCPLRYKFARLLRVPAETTPQQRFGILMHQVLERYHGGLAAASGADGDGAADAHAGEPALGGEAVGTGKGPGRGDPRPGSLASLLGLLDWGWRRAGFRNGPQDRALLEKARGALGDYHRRLGDEESRPVWFERGFSVAVGPHLVRGRVDRVDRLPGGGFELIDYKTGFPRTPAQLDGDIQLSLYALAARTAWNVEATRLSYYFLLDDRKVPLPVQPGEVQMRRISDTIRDVGDRILALRFGPTPSYSVCSSCEFLAACPAAES